MKNITLTQKLKKFKKYVEEFYLNHKSGIEDVHKLRVSSRELFSLMSHDEIFSKKIKKVIKLSNKVRDLDVFFEVYLQSLPKKFIDELDIQSIVESTDKIRQKGIDKLHLYLKYLEIPQKIEFNYEDIEPDIVKIDELEFNQEELHKYRMYIKKRLFKEKNSYPLNKKKIQVLTKIKDLLGDINDYSNGLKRLETYDIEPTFFKKIEEFTQEQNDILFKEFKTINRKGTL